VCVPARLALGLPAYQATREFYAAGAGIHVSGAVACHGFVDTDSREDACRLMGGLAVAGHVCTVMIGCGMVRRHAAAAQSLSSQRMVFVLHPTFLSTDKCLGLHGRHRTMGWHLVLAMTS